MAVRDDLTLAAYAVALGYTLKGYSHCDLKPTPDIFNEHGIPSDALQFEIGDVHIWLTAKGWRVARLIDGFYEKPNDSHFYRKLKDALVEGDRNWRDR